MTTLRLIADDLTGALDSGAQFTGCAGPLPVLIGPTVAVPAGSFALNLSCRDGARAEAIAAARCSIPYFAGADLAFKKIDSLMRGHWAAELAEIAKSGAFERIVVAPAFPAQGRLTRAGRQVHVNAEGGDVLIADIAAELSRHGVVALPAADGEGRGRIVLLDASSQADLDAISQRSDEASTLWCGTAGLARALAGRPASVACLPDAPHLVIVGSHHPVAQRQVAELARLRPDWLTAFDAEAEASAERIHKALAAHGRCVALPDLPAGLTSPEAARLIAERLQALCRRLVPPAVLTVVGGETLAALCLGLGASRLLVKGELHPGVPAFRLVMGSWTRTICFSKSGAFGPANWLIEQLRAED